VKPLRQVEAVERLHMENHHAINGENQGFRLGYFQ
jgi:hypothetical protein